MQYPNHKYRILLCVHFFYVMLTSIERIWIDQDIKATCLLEAEVGQASGRVGGRGDRFGYYVTFKDINFSISWLQQNDSKSKTIKLIKSY